eukprot:CAMPEP_0197632852 /NCGR_PEP_ID=MMETSP1338-20131121/9399_1 /TAXON_ID=43686 ORGANISM="Pelagodinium beii, Strain RCC1491" /NCGR_SAMPLE_ID=MMETSP1338 /ASSEMBLY_ACC=CAM_ASM_000754 /LENGTH=544 /DNA_ID=CAMNT_0043204423 /DNA_START=43 /DNA_END=1677 /DNA_ORIENTATION=+
MARRRLSNLVGAEVETEPFWLSDLRSSSNAPTLSDGITWEQNASGEWVRAMYDLKPSASSGTSSEASPAWHAANAVTRSSRMDRMKKSLAVSTDIESLTARRNSKEGIRLPSALTRSGSNDSNHIEVSSRGSSPNSVGRDRRFSKNSTSSYSPRGRHLVRSEDPVPQILPSTNSSPRGSPDALRLVPSPRDRRGRNAEANPAQAPGMRNSPDEQLTGSGESPRGSIPSRSPRDGRQESKQSNIEVAAPVVLPPIDPPRDGHRSFNRRRSSTNEITRVQGRSGYTSSSPPLAPENSSEAEKPSDLTQLQFDISRIQDERLQKEDKISTELCQSMAAEDRTETVEQQEPEQKESAEQPEPAETGALGDQTKSRQVRFTSGTSSARSSPSTNSEGSDSVAGADPTMSYDSRESADPEKKEVETLPTASRAQRRRHSVEFLLNNGPSTNWRKVQALVTGQAPIRSPSLSEEKPEQTFTAKQKRLQQLRELAQVSEGLGSEPLGEILDAPPLTEHEQYWKDLWSLQRSAYDDGNLLVEDKCLPLPEHLV